jgi:hypothetical protein
LRCQKLTQFTRPGEEVCPKCSPDYRIEQEREYRKAKRALIGGRTLGDDFTCCQCGKTDRLIHSKQKRCMECIKKNDEQRRPLGSLFTCAVCCNPTELTLGKQKLCKERAYEEKKRKNREEYWAEPAPDRKSVGFSFKCIICDKVVVREKYLQICCSEKSLKQRTQEMYVGSRRRWINSSYEIKLNLTISSAISRSLRGAKDGRKWQSIVGYSRADLIRHLERGFEDGMSWSNYGWWHVDHIRPLDSFHFKNPEDPDFRDAWSLPNLRPSWWIDNFKKGSKRIYLI